MLHTCRLPVSVPALALAAVLPGLAACGGSSSAPPVPSLGFGAPRTFATGTTDARALAFADLDGDGIAEALVADASQGMVAVLPGQPSGFDQAVLVPGPAGVDALAVGDLDNNRTADVLAGSSTTAELALLINSGAGLGLGGRIPVASPASSLALVDLDGNGRADLVWSSATRAEFGLLPRDNASGFRMERALPLPARPGRLLVGDFDGDGQPDLAAAAAGGGQVMVLRNGGGTFGAAVETSVAPQSGEAVTGDLDGDGVLDLVTIRAGNAVLDLLRGDGTGAFSAVGEVTLTGEADGLSLADRDLDGDLDLWVALRGGGVAVLAGDGNFGFGTLERLAEDSQGLVAAQPRDADRDGIPDLVWLSGGQSLAVAANPRPVPLGLQPYGTGTPDCGGALTLIGNQRPQVGAAGFALLAAGAPPAAPGLLLLGGPQDVAGSDPLGLGFLIHVGTGALTTRFVVADPQGGLFAREPIPATASLAGLDVFAQALWLARPGEHCSTSLVGVLSSRGLQMTVQP